MSYAFRRDHLGALKPKGITHTVLSSRSMKLWLVVIVFALAACSLKTEIPTEFPTPEPPPSAKPLPKLELKRDAELEKQFAEIANGAKGKVGAAAVVLETGEAALLNADEHYPMQSVYKLPISMAVMDQIRKDNHALDEKIGVTKADMVRQGQASPLRDKNPNGGEFTIRELIRLALIESDGTASDVLMRVAGGPNSIQSYLSQIGINDMKVVNTEKEMGADWNVQYQNWATPTAAADLLRFFETSIERDSSETNDVLLDFTTHVITGPKRIKGLLPKDAVVAHKTGTSGTRDGITAATNDIGVIYLPNGKHLAIAVFVSDSPADEKTRESVIARIAKAAFDRWQTTGSK
jgi:beta-lactamase class A